MVKNLCRECMHYYITYEPRMPHACRAHAFKAAQMPCIVVRQSSGMECTLFEQKQKRDTQK